MRQLLILTALASAFLLFACGDSDGGLVGELGKDQQKDATVMATPPPTQTKTNRLPTDTPTPLTPVPTPLPTRAADFASLCQKTTEKSWSEPPPMIIDPELKYRATIKLGAGEEIIIHLLPEIAPYTVNNFVFLACSGFYDGLVWHRLLPFIAETGDPTGTGEGGPGYTIPDEFNSDSFNAYMVGMVKMAAPNSGGSQFFVALETRPELDGEYTWFGVVGNGFGFFIPLWQRQHNDSTYYLSPEARIQEITIEELSSW